MDLMKTGTRMHYDVTKNHIDPGSKFPWMLWMDTKTIYSRAKARAD